MTIAVMPAAPKASEREYLTIGEVTALTGLSRSTLRRAVERGQLAGWQTPGGHNRIARSDVESFLTRLGRREEDE